MAKSGIFNQGAILDGLYGALDAGRSFEGRETYVGASEVGSCRRLLVHNKLTGVETREKFNPTSAWKVLQGRILEGAVVSILRKAGVDLRETGHRQQEFRHADVALVTHPDGKVLPPFEHLGEQDGEGGLEIKTTSSFLLKSWIEKGLPEYYLDQPQVEMGLSGRKWLLFVAVARDQAFGKGEGATFMHWWIVDFDQERYDRAVERAKVTCDHLDRKELPEGEPDRAFDCEKCSIAMECQAYLKSIPELAPDQDLPQETKIELDVILEELGQIEGDWAPLDSRIKKLKEQAKAITPQNAKRDFILSAGTVKVGSKQVADFDAVRLVTDVKARVDNLQELPESSREEIKAAVEDVYKAESSRKKTQYSISLKPRKGE